METKSGDSLGQTINAELQLALKWWTFAHFGVDFTVREDLPITRQEDGYSCGLLAWQAVMAFVLND